jgi:hypothetical protein
MVGMQIDGNELRDAMRLYARATKKDEVAIINRTARNFAIKVLPKTPKATSDKIEGDLKALPERTFRGVLFKRMYAHSRQGAKVMAIFQGNLDQGSRQALAMAAAKFIAQRRSSAGYIRAGWHNIARAFGAFSAVAADRRKKGRAVQDSKATKATDSTSIIAAEFENMAKGSGDVALGATQQALQAVISDMRDYAYRVMQGTANQFSARKGGK